MKNHYCALPSESYRGFSNGLSKVFGKRRRTKMYHAVVLGDCSYEGRQPSLEL